MLLPLALSLSMLQFSTPTLPPTNIKSVRIVRTPCFGGCPVYRATIYSDGSFQYFGERYVDKLGRWKGNVGAEKASQLFRVIERIGFDELKPRYRIGATDLPSTTITVNRPRSSKEVYCYGDVPEVFWATSVLIDKVLDESKPSWEEIPIKEQIRVGD